MYFINYNKCSTCMRAKKFLDDNNIEYIDRQIKENNLTYDEIKEIISKYNIPIKKLFNTSGILYREMDLKNKLLNMNEDEMIKLLSSDGMLVKRPIIISDNNILIGFKESKWKEELLNKQFFFLEKMNLQKYLKYAKMSNCVRNIG